MPKPWKMICDYCGTEGEWKWDWPPTPLKHTFCNTECWENYHHVSPRRALLEPDNSESCRIENRGLGNDRET